MISAVLEPKRRFRPNIELCLNGCAMERRRSNSVQGLAWNRCNLALTDDWLKRKSFHIDKLRERSHPCSPDPGRAFKLILGPLFQIKKIRTAAAVEPPA